MENDRTRVSLDDPYAYALGLAAFCFARCEWDAVWCCERLQPNYINTIELKRKTAGVIANELMALIEAIPDTSLKKACQRPAAEFKRLVVERNSLLHGKPGTAANGEQRLFHFSVEWTIAAINNLSDQFTACQIDLNDIVHKHLALV